MALMTQTRLTMATHNCRGILERLAQKIPSDSLMGAVNRYDSDAVDDILEKRCAVSWRLITCLGAWSSSAGNLALQKTLLPWMRLTAFSSLTATGTRLTGS